MSPTFLPPQTRDVPNPRAESGRRSRCKDNNEWRLVSPLWNAGWSTKSRHAPSRHCRGERSMNGSVWDVFPLVPPLALPRTRGQCFNNYDTQYMRTPPHIPPLPCPPQLPYNVVMNFLSLIHHTENIKCIDNSHSSPGHIPPALRTRQVQRGVPVQVSHPGIATRADQRLRRAHVSREGGKVQGSVANNQRSQKKINERKWRVYRVERMKMMYFLCLIRIRDYLWL